jgi:hypothetical protein
MQVSMKLIVAVAAAALAGVATAQPATTSVGRAASAAVTPGDQDMGRNPGNRSGGLMGNDTATGSAATSVGRAASAAVTPGDQDMGRNPGNRSGGLMGNDSTGTRSATTGGRRPARADRG